MHDSCAGGLIGANYEGQCRSGPLPNLGGGRKWPTTLEADPILADQGVFIIPDILANAGGVIVSYFEWVQDAQRFFWKATDIRESVHEIITDAFQRTMEFSIRQRTSMRMAALMNGIIV